ncbi:MAG: DUF294 nucleotidyltransferase-like domain-containing protein [Edaphocola sp.]
MDNRINILQQIPPFSLLPYDVLGRTAHRLEEKALRQQDYLYEAGNSSLKGMEIVVQGSLGSWLEDENGTRHYEELHKANTCLADESLLMGRSNATRTVLAEQDTLVWSLGRAEFKEIAMAHPDFLQYFTAPFSLKMLDTDYAALINGAAIHVGPSLAGDYLFSRTIDTVKYKEIVSLPPHTPAFEAAQYMRLKKVSCLFVQDASGAVLGYVTDITFRDNVVALRKSSELTIAEIMDGPVQTIGNNDYVFEAIFKMFNTHSRYLLVADQGVPNGFVSRNRLLSEQAESPLLFMQSVRQVKDIARLKDKWLQVPQLVNKLLQQGVKASVVNQMVSSVSDTIGEKIISDILQKIGPAPARFAIMVLGSEGRMEQTLSTDQDNALIYEDVSDAQRPAARAWFLNFGKMVADQLNEAGFKYCSGDYMASNHKWNHSLSHWKQNYERWIGESVPETAMSVVAFFDCRLLYGDANIMNELTDFIRQKLTGHQERLYFFIAKNALRYEAPLTFFKNLRTFTVGNEEVIDVKRAMTPIVDIARMYALKHSVMDTNTGLRLKRLRNEGVFTHEEYQVIAQSYYFLMGLRLRHQTRQILEQGTRPDNFFPVKYLSKIEQATLLAVFKTLEKLQGKVRIQFNGSL